MMHRRIEELYGFGAARIALRGEAFSVGDPDHALRRAAAIFVRDMRADGLRRILTYSGAPVLGLALAVILAMATLLVRPEIDDSDISIVAFEVAELIPPPLAVPIVEPETLIPPPIAKLEPPPPLPIAKLEPPVARPAPPVVRPEPLPLEAVPLVRRVRPEPAPRVEPKPEARPRVQIDSLVLASVPEVRPEPAARREPRAEPQEQRSRIAVAPLAAAPLPELSAKPAPTRERFRLASAAPSSSSVRPAVRVDPMPARIADAPRDEPTDRRARPALLAAPPVERDRPRPALAPSQSLAPRNDSEPRARSARTAPEPVGTPSRRSANVGVPQLNAPATARAPQAEARRVARVDPVAAPADGRSRTDQEGKLSGVPLGSLAACVSDQEEDALKQQVVSAVTAQKECLSGAGRYRFIQTKNLNSFLMWVDRARGRVEADRCAELRYALDCLKRQARTGSRS